MKKKIKHRWIAMLLLSAILSGILANHFGLSAQTPMEETSEPITARNLNSDYNSQSELIRSNTPQVNLYINSNRVEVTSYLISDTTYVPLRAFCEELDDCNISWNDGIASVESSELNMRIQQGSHYIEANDRIIYHDEPILNVESRIYVPIRTLAKVYNLSVAWEGKTKTVYLAGNPRALKKGKDFYNEEDIYWLSRIIQAESGGEPLLGKIAVGNVIINRKNRNDYPNTIKAVIFDKKYGTQFTPVANGSIYNTPSSDSIRAAKIVLDGYSLNEHMIFFLNPRAATNFWITQNRIFVTKIGNHAFYK
ncbi:MAG: cell wall hydrolase [Clostridia bacterium]|nr:cell wall hydrolase [Clostridia bacterium]